MSKRKRKKYFPSIQKKAQAELDGFVTRRTNETTKNTIQYKPRTHVAGGAERKGSIGTESFGVIEHRKPGMSRGGCQLA